MGKLFINIHEIKKFLIDKYGPGINVSIYGEVMFKIGKMLLKYSTRSKTGFLVGNPTTGGFGLTLTAVNTVIYFSNNYNLEMRKQSEDRAHRMGQKGLLFILIL